MSTVSTKVIAQLCAIDLRWGDVVEIDGSEFMVITISRNEENGWITPDVRIQLANEEESQTHHVLISDLFNVTRIFPRY